MLSLSAINGAITLLVVSQTEMKPICFVWTKSRNNKCRLTTVLIIIIIVIIIIKLALYLIHNDTPKLSFSKLVGTQ